MLILEKNSKLIITDSGGLSRESYFFKIPSVVLRNTTEWVEITQCGYSKLVDTANKNEIIDSIKELLNDNYLNNKKWDTFYGNGHATENIIKYLIGN